MVSNILRSNASVRAAVASLAIAGLAGPTLADSTWTGSTNQVWDNAANWSNGFPGTAPTTNAVVNTATGNYPIISATPSGTPVDIFIGNVLGSPGRLDQTAGTAATGNGNWFFVGSRGGTGTFNLANTAVTGTGISGFGQGSGSLTVGRFWVAGADFNDNGNGVVNINTTGTLTATDGDGSVVVGEAYSGSPGAGFANGTVNFESGTILSNQQTFIGRSGTGTWNQSGGTFSSVGYVAVGREFAGKFGDANVPGTGTLAGNGVINLTGGTFNSSSGYGFTSIGGGTDSTGALNISGTGVYDASFVTPEATANGGVVVGEGWQGPTTSVTQASLTVSGSGELRLGANAIQIGLTAQGNGTVNLNGGTISTARIYKGAGTATFNFNGGTLKPTADTATLLSGPYTQVRNGGAVINTNGFNVTIPEAIVHSVVGGDNAVDGGLTKSGSGTLTLSGVNGYTGVTTVKAGTLKVSYSSILASSSTPLLTGAAGTDVQNGTLILDYTGGTTPAAIVRNLLKASFQAATTPGVMETGQIRSSTATIKKGLGYRDDATGNVTVKVALFGDADLDGGVSINDFNALAGNFGQSTGKVWVDGDFDYDGGVSINDFNLLAGNFGQTLPASGDAFAGLLAFAAAHNDLAAFEAVTGVPEPTTIGLMGAVGVAALRRRRR